jgi:hypothetical protein
LSWSGGQGTGVSYTITYSPAAAGATATATSSPVTITGLATNTTYTITLNAIVAGNTVQSASTTVTPISPYPVNPAFYYPFQSNLSNYALGTAITDTIPFGSPAINTSKAYYTGINGSLYCSSASYGVTLPPNSISVSSGFTVSFWVYFTSASAGMVWEIAASDGTRTMVYWTGYAISLYYNSTGATAFTGLTTNTWYFITYVIPTTGQPYGVLNNTTTYTFSGVTLANTAGFFHGINQEINQPSGGVPGIYFNNFALYNRVLTSAERTQLYSMTTLVIPETRTGTNIPANPIFYYPFQYDLKNYVTGYGVTDTSSLGTTSISASKVYKTGIAGAAYFSTSGTGLQLANVGITLTSGLTVTLWFNLSQNSSGMLWELANNTTRSILYYNSISGFLACYNGSDNVIVPASSISTNTWYFVAFVIPTSGAPYVTLNNSSTYSLTSYGSTSYTTTFHGINRELNQSAGGVPGVYINNFALYDRVLTSAELTQLYNLSAYTLPP